MIQSAFLRTSIYLALILLTLISISCSSGSVVDDTISEAARSYRPTRTPPDPVDRSANNYNIQMLNGSSTRMSELVGNKKVVLVNFWATWCPPCRREIPELTALKKQFEGKGVEIVGLTVEEPDKQSVVEVFAQQYSINYSLGFAPMEVFTLFNRANGNHPGGSIPQTFIFDKNGKLVDSVRGLRPNFRTWAEGAIGYALKNS